MNFTRIKRWGMLVGIKIDTIVSQEDGGIVIHQEVMKAFGSDSVKDNSIRFSTLTNVNTHLDINNWDIMLAILSGIMGIFYNAPYLGLLLSAILIWQSYGYEIVIRTKDGTVYKIPYNKRNEDVDVFLKFLKEELQNISRENLKEFDFNENRKIKTVKKDVIDNNEVEQKLFCRECGKELQKECKLCPICGTPVIYIGK